MGDVSFSLSVAGQPAAEPVLAAIRQIEVEESLDLTDIARLRFAVAVKEDGSGWTIADDDLFPRLAQVKVQVTVGDGQAETLLDGHVVEATLAVSNEPGKSTFEVIALGPAVLMALEEKIRAFPDQSDGDIVTSICSEYGFDTDVESTQPTWQSDDVTIVQRGTDLELARTLARRNGFEFYVEIDGASGSPKAHFHPRRLDGEAQAVLTAHMGDASNVDDIQVRYNMVRPAQVKAAGLDAATLEAQEAEITSASVRALGATSTLGDDRPRKIVTDRTGLFQTADLQAHAQALADRAAWAVSAEGTVTTAAFRRVLRARRLVSLRGVGQKLSGEYLVERVVHLITGDSYKQRFTLARTATGVAGSERFTDDEGR